MPTTEVILTDNVPGLGAEADVVKVRRGYARNYLLPRGKAYEVTPAALRQLDTLKKKRAEREGRESPENLCGPDDGQGQRPVGWRKGQPGRHGAIVEPDQSVP